MLDVKVAAWDKALDAAFAAEENTDLEPLWLEVSAEIEAQPRHAGLRRLRMRMAEAFFEHAQLHEDLCALRDIEPGNRDVRLQLALVQHRWAFLIAPDEEDAAAEGGDAQSDDVVEVTRRDLEGGDDQQARTQLEHEALGWIAQLLRQHRADADFCATVLHQCSEASIYAPWLRLTLVLELAAAHPRDVRFKREVAMAWQELANQAPEGHDPDSGQLPMGFMLDVNGTLWDPFLQERALDAIDALLQRSPADTDLLARRARLLEARCDFPKAALAYAAAQGVLVTAAGQSADEEERESLAASAAEMGERSRLCQAGRVAIAEAMMAGIDDAIAQFRQALPVREDASEQARQFAQDWQKSMQASEKEFSESVDTLRATIPSHTLDPDVLEAFEAQAEQIATGIAASIELSPHGAFPVEPAQFESDWATPLAPVRAQFLDAGWRDLAWLEWPAFRKVFGHQVASAVMINAAGDSIAMATIAKGVLLVDLETELSDGRFIATSTSRGRNFLAAGIDLDTLLIEPSLQISEAVALHAARVDLALSVAPTCVTVKCADIGQAIQQQERIRELKTRFRLERGITESESLGIPHDFPEVFAPMLRAAFAKRMHELRLAQK